MSARAVLCLLALCAAVGADLESARYFLGRGRRALDEKKLDDAEKFFLKSVAERSGFVPGYLGLSEVARRRDRTKEMIRNLEMCAAQRKRFAELKEDEREALAAAEVLLANADRGRTEFRRIVQDYVARLITLADKSRKSKPRLARECVERVLKVQPDQKEARRILTEVGGSASATPAAAEVDGTPLWNGTDLSNWNGGPPVFTVKDGVFHADAGRDAYWIRNLKEVKGDFTLIVEIRIVKESGPHPLFRILFRAHGPYEHLSLSLWPEGWRMEETRAQNERGDLNRRNYNRYRGKFNRFAWNTYRIEVKERVIRCFANDQALFDQKTPKDPDGFVGFSIQECTIEVRRCVLKK